MIEIKGISKNYGNKTALDHVSFTVQKGQIVGLLGRNGAGKSTTMNIITGYLSSDAGTVEIDGYDILEQPLEAKKRIGYLPEQPPLYYEMTVYDYLDFVCKLRGFSKKNIPVHLDEILQKIHIEDVKNRLIGNLSKGYKQRVGLAQALCGKPNTIILDEPTVGLDPTQMIEIRQIIKDLGKEHTVILSSHILKEIADICSYVVILHQGKKVADDSMANLLQISEGERTHLVRIKNAEGDFLSALRSIGGVLDVKLAGEVEVGFTDFEISSTVDSDIREALFQTVARANRTLTMLKTAELSLEDIFTKLTKDEESAAI